MKHPNVTTSCAPKWSCLYTSETLRLALIGIRGICKTCACLAQSIEYVFQCTPKYHVYIDSKYALNVSVYTSPIWCLFDLNSILQVVGYNIYHIAI